MGRRGRAGSVPSWSCAEAWPKSPRMRFGAVRTLSIGARPTRSQRGSGRAWGGLLPAERLERSIRAARSGQGQLASSPMTVAPLTSSQVKKAGHVLRKHARGEAVDAASVARAFDVLLAFRAEHSMPLRKANMGLRSMVRTAGAEVEVSQRLKRVPTILDKLQREPTLALSKMQDIGGCRAVLANVDEVRRVEARLKKNRPPVGYADYIEQPRASGYRGVHVVVEYDGRSIEVQLRTRVMHAWAITVERLAWRLGENLKGDGDHVVQQLLRVISEAMAVEERGDVVDASLLAELEALRAQAAPYLAVGGR